MLSPVFIDRQHKSFTRFFTKNRGFQRQRRCGAPQGAKFFFFEKRRRGRHNSPMDCFDAETVNKVFFPPSDEGGGTREARDGGREKP